MINFGSYSCCSSGVVDSILLKNHLLKIDKNKLGLSWDKLSQRYASWTRSSSIEGVFQ